VDLIYQWGSKREGERESFLLVMHGSSFMHHQRTAICAVVKFFWQWISWAKRCSAPASQIISDDNSKSTRGSLPLPSREDKKLARRQTARSESIGLGPKPWAPFAFVEPSMASVHGGKSSPLLPPQLWVTRGCLAGVVME